MATEPYAPLELGAILAGGGGSRIAGAMPMEASGTAIAAAGDVNGDGFDDLLIGAPFNSQRALLCGAAYVVFGRPEGLGAEVDLGAIAAEGGGIQLTGGYSGLGSVVASTGDMNGDGFDDIVVVEGNGPDYFYAGYRSNSYVVLGRADPPPSNRMTVEFATAASGGFALRDQPLLRSGEYDYTGTAVVAASAGDLNGDGFDDLVLGGGRSVVVFGAAQPPTGDLALDSIGTAVPGFEIRDGAAGFNGSAAPAGDVNGDGFDDLVLSGFVSHVYGQGDVPSEAYSSASHVVFGRDTGFDPTLDVAALMGGTDGFALLDEAGAPLAGSRIVSAGDVNGDSVDDLLLGRDGGVYVIFGRAGIGRDGPVALGDIARGEGGFVIRAAPGAAGPLGFASAVAAAGDVNGDGFGDIVIAASGTIVTDDGFERESEVYLLFGKAEGFEPRIDPADLAAGRGGLVIGADASLGFFAAAVAGAGDVNGDGFDDIAIGVPGELPSPGETFLIHGGGFRPAIAGAGAAADTIDGTGGDDVVEGLGGDDRLQGRGGDDTVIGGAGNDSVWGGGGADVLSGGSGADRFVFGGLALGAVDRILDLDAAAGDRIVLRGIDADRATPADDAFVAIGSAAFSGTAGELRWEDRGRGVQRIEGDVDGDGVGDLVIELVDALPVEVGWFVL